MRCAAPCFFVVTLATGAAISAAEPRFEAQTIDPGLAIGYGLAIGDVDGDGKPDIVLADKKQFVWYKNGVWKRTLIYENLTQRDNVCLDVADINGDGKVELAVGANWNPRDTVGSGSVHYMIRPDDLSKTWTPVKLHHEPVIHRMRWLYAGGGRWQLAVLPLHGRGNKGGKGAGVKFLAYEIPKNVKDPWSTHGIDDTMHVTHNFDVQRSGRSIRHAAPPSASWHQVILGGREGIVMMIRTKTGWKKYVITDGKHGGAGEVRLSNPITVPTFVAAVEPLHGNTLALYQPQPGAKESWKRTVLYDDLKQGHALACADLLYQGRDQIVVGWRNRNSERKVGIKLFISEDKLQRKWRSVWIDENKMACEDLKIADLDADGRPDIIACGRATKNLVIYWNRSK